MVAERPLSQHEGRRRIDRVLVMASPPAESSLLAHHFERLGCTVEEVDSAEAVLAAARERVPDLIVVDRQRLPNMPTQRLINELCDDPATAGCRVVVASGLQFAEVAPGAPRTQEHGADDVLDLPYTRMSIQQLIDQVDSAADDRGSTPDGTRGT